MAVPLLVAEKHWTCPNCDHTDVTMRADIHSRFHNCRGLKGLSAPMVEDGTKAKVEARERQDYVGREHVQYDGDGRPVMSIVTTRDEGQDCVVLAPVAAVTKE